MRPLDWLVLVSSLVAVVCYGLWRGRGSDTVGKYLLAGKTMPWYAMALSIMATQASAITFISTTGQAYVDGMRFVQFYFGLPLAMVVLSATAVPIFHRAGVYTAYEYLERRFDAKTRVLVSLIFLIQRGLAVGVALYAPAVVLTVILGWPDRLTTVAMGSLVVLYTTLGGIKAVTWTDFQQMLIMLAGIVAALATAVFLLPDQVSFGDALTVAGAAGRLNAVTTRFDWNDRYNLWSGLIGGMFLALSYFGCDQSQVQRYLTGKSIAQSRLSLLFNAVAKVPMQFFILFTGAVVFVFYTFEKPPLLFQPVTLERMRHERGFEEVERRYEAAFARRREAAAQLIEVRRNGDALARQERVRQYRDAERLFEETRRQAVRFAESRGISGVNDTGDVVHFGRNQFSGDRHRGGSIPAPHPPPGSRQPLPEGSETGHAVLGRLRRPDGGVRCASGRVDRGGQHGWFVLLRRDAWGIHPGLLLPARDGERSVCGGAVGGGGDSAHLAAHGCFVPLVQRNRLRRGGGLRSAAVAAEQLRWAEARLRRPFGSPHAARTCAAISRSSGSTSPAATASAWRRPRPKYSLR
jgi:hypothetical protein